jgi:hypothetical protein
MLPSEPGSSSEGGPEPTVSQYLGIGGAAIMRASSLALPEAPSARVATEESLMPA